MENLFPLFQLNSAGRPVLESALDAKIRSILLVEDDTLVAMLAEDMLVELGYELHGNPRNVAEALLAVKRGGFDAAMLDVNLAGEKAYPVAEALAASGIPFIFSTGYGEQSVPPEYGGWPVAAKPYTIDGLGQALADAFAQAGAA
jgi:CheY-like chemotaxis protein